MIAWNQFEVGNHRIECPSCGRGGRDKTAGLTINQDGTGVIHCFRCAYVESYRPRGGSAIHVQNTLEQQKSKPQKLERLSDWGMNIWNSTQELGGVALQYLASRRCAIPPADSHLRWHPSLKNRFCGHIGPALVALVTHIHTREPLSLHQTWITPHGKADIETPRLILGKHTTENGVIRLYPDDWVTSWLGLAEGIETALSLALAYQPVWATIDAGHLAKFPVLTGVGDLVIAQDQDQAGIAAANQCANRWADAGRRVLKTNQKTNDLNDLVMEIS
jgi:hypothetical protein